MSKDQGRQFNFVRALSTLRAEQYASIGITLFACLITIIVYFMAKSTNDYSGFYISLVISTTSAVVADRIARFMSENRVMKELRSFNPTVHDLQYIGDGLAGIEWLCNNYSGANSVWNTVYRPQHARLSFIFEAREQFDSIARTLIGRRCSWHDLIIDDPRCEVAAFHGSLPEEQRQAHHVRTLRSYLPIFQILILDFRKDHSAVLFGWGHSEIGSSRVYLSTDSATVQDFKDYFLLLWDKHSDPVPSPPSPHPPKMDIPAAQNN